MTAPGKVILVEGADDSGKSTLVRRLHDLLQVTGVPAVALCEPAKATEMFGAKVRQMLAAQAQGGLKSWPPEAWASVMLAAMIEQDQITRDAVKHGRVVLFDRREVSTLVYQAIMPQAMSASRQADLQNFIITVARVLAPIDLILYLDAPADYLAERRVAAASNADGGKDQQAFSDFQTQRRVVDGYKEVLSWAGYKPRVFRIDAMQSADEVFRRALGAVQNILPPGAGG